MNYSSRSKNKQIIIVGAGESAAIAYEYFTHDSPYSIVGFAVEREYIVENEFLGLPVLPYEEIEERHDPSNTSAFVAISSSKLNRVRTRLYNQTKSKGYDLATYVSSNAFVWKNVEIGENSFIFENNVLQPFTEVKNNVVLWSGNHIGHRTVICDNVFVSSHVVISGYCKIENSSFIGVNSSVANNVTIAKDNFIAMQSGVTKNTEENSIYKGMPAQRSKVSALEYCGVEES